MKLQDATEAYHLEGFRSYMSDMKKLVEFELSKVVSRFSELKLHPQIAYSVLSKGKRLRPLLVILSAESVGGDRNSVMPLALAFEFVHTATLVHDDAIDDDRLRRGIPTLHRRWSIGDAILAGDAMIALAVNLASSFGEKVLKAVSQSALELCDGEHLDLTCLSLEKGSEEEYLLKIKQKSASLFEAATYAGALASGGSSLEVESLSNFGRNFGMAYQLRDDLLDLVPKESSISQDLKSGRVTLPLIHLYGISKLERRKELERDLESLRNRLIINHAAETRILNSLKLSGSLTYCEKKIDTYVREAVGSLSPLKDSEGKIRLVQMATALKDWKPFDTETSKLDN